MVNATNLTEPLITINNREIGLALAFLIVVIIVGVSMVIGYFLNNWLAKRKQPKETPKQVPKPQMTIAEKISIQGIPNTLPELAIDKQIDAELEKVTNEMKRMEQRVELIRIDYVNLKNKKNKLEQMKKLSRGG